MDIHYGNYLEKLIIDYSLITNMYLIQNLSNVNDTEESTDTVKQKKDFFIIPFINKLFNTVDIKV